MEKTTNLAEILVKLNEEYEARQIAACEALVERHYKVFAQKAQEVAAEGERNASVNIRLAEVTPGVIAGLKKRLEDEGLKNVSLERVGHVKPCNSASHLCVSAEW